MKTINLFLMDMAEGNTTTGVDRYLEMLLKGLMSYPFINVYRIQLRHSLDRLLHTYEEKESYHQVIIPLPQQMGEVIREYFWTQKYNEVVYSLISHLFENKTRILLHIHTLNLIDLASYIRSKVECRIITHLHCIPWKAYYNYNRLLFNSLYESVYKWSSVTCQDLITGRWEIRSYHDADHVICVTRCGKKFVQAVSSREDHSIDIVPNGMSDFRDRVSSSLEESPVELLYVGALSESKGLLYILDSMRIVKKKGYNILLNIAGKGSIEQIHYIMQNYSDVNFNLLGDISFDKLKTYYQRSAIGVIASLQEQASYVAIEMAMFGLPIITTAVDGLDELFTDEVTALKVSTLFSKRKGLSVDIVMMADKMIDLIINEEKRHWLGLGGRRLYEEKLTLEKMVDETVSIYQKVLK